MTTEKQKLTVEEIFFKVQTSFYVSGLARELGATKTHILFAIASYMDEDGKCHPTQKQLSERTGISTKTIGEKIQDILDIRVGGKPILKATKYKTKAGHYNYAYRIMPVSQISKFEGTVEKIEPLFYKEEVDEVNELEAALASL